MNLILYILYMYTMHVFEFDKRTRIELAGKPDRVVALLSWKEISKMIRDWSGKPNVLNNVLKYLKY